jgi:hypothetical protein
MTAQNKDQIRVPLRLLGVSAGKLQLKLPKQPLDSTNNRVSKCNRNRFKRCVYIRNVLNHVCKLIIDKVMHSPRTPKEADSRSAAFCKASTASGNFALLGKDWDNRSTLFCSRS